MLLTLLFPNVGRCLCESDSLLEEEEQLESPPLLPYLLSGRRGDWLSVLLYLELFLNVRFLGNVQNKSVMSVTLPPSLLAFVDFR